MKERLKRGKKKITTNSKKRLEISKKNLIL
jgi:hypothetical protein